MRKWVHFFSSVPAEKTVILFNYNHLDGIGDFAHFMGYAQQFIPLAKKINIRIVPLILCSSERKEYIETQLKSLPGHLLPFILAMDEPQPGNDCDDQFKRFLEAEGRLRLALQNALSIIQISTATTQKQKDCLLTYAPANIPVVNIPEINGLRCTASLRKLSVLDPRDELSESDQAGPNINTRWMGLYDVPYEYGIKLNPPLVRTPEEIVASFTNQDFLRRLIGIEDTRPVTSEQLSNFLGTSQLVPAYLQRHESTVKFVAFCIQRFQRSDKSDLVIHANKPNFDLKANYTIGVEDTRQLKIKHPNLVFEEQDGKFKMSRIEHQLIFSKVLQISGLIEIIDGDKKKTIDLRQNPEEKPHKTIRLITGFHLDNDDYDQLIAMATDIVAISGDNTFEKALSHNKLPFLQPGKCSFEWLMKELSRIAKKYVTPAIGDAIDRYFSENMRLDNPSRFKNLLSINIAAVHHCWSAIMDGLRKDYNIYNHCESIFYEPMLHMSAEEGNTALLKSIYQCFPNVDFFIPNRIGQTAMSIAQGKGHHSYVNELEKCVKEQQGTGIIFNP